MSVNKVILVGRLGQDPELRYTPQQTPVCNFSLATSDFAGGGDRNGGAARQEKTTWHRVVVWGKSAELCSKYLAKGRQVYLEGRLVVRQWQDKEGQNRTTVEVHSNSVQFRDNGSNRSGQPQSESSYAQSSESGSSMLSSTYASSPLSSGSAPSEPTFTEDDIPF